MKLKKEQIVKFSEQLAQRFLIEVDGFFLTSSIQDLNELGVRLVRKKRAAEVGKIAMNALSENECVFYSKTKRDASFFLLKHFRNCASHKDRIEVVQRNGKAFYQFEDRGNSYGKPYISMRALIQADIWDEYIDNLFKEAVKGKQKKKD